jgi:quercetin dioxygenase-like cupin family protein
MTFPDFVSSCPELELPFHGARGWLVQGEGQQVIFIEFSEAVEVPEHSHEQQWEFIVAGRVILHMEGGSREYVTGDNFFIPSGVPHGATVQAGYKALIIFNSPERFRQKK